MDSNIFGRDAKLYGANVGSRSYSKIKKAFTNSTFIKNISVGFPIKDGTGSTGSAQNYLYKDGVFQNSTATLWDKYASTWQLMPILCILAKYTGKVDTNEAFKLFPNRIIDTAFDTYYVTDDDLMNVQVIYIGGEDIPAEFGFNKSSLEENKVHYLNYVIFGNESFSKYSWCNLYFCASVNNKQYQSKYSIEYRTEPQIDSWWMQSYKTGTFIDTTGFIQNYIPMPEDTDPYSKGGSSKGTGGTSGGSGSGTFDNTSDVVEIPSLPTYSAVDTGFITIFNPTISELKNLANYMWSNDLFNLDTWKKIFDNPMDAILGLSIVPVAVPEGGSSDVTVGNIITTVSMTKASTQYVAVDCGSLDIKEYWGGYMDYAPYTKAELYLPYCGTHPINIDDIMGKTVQVVYHVDILSGACVAYVKCGSSVLYSFVGQCSSSIPITSSDMSNVISGMITMGASIGSMVATGGLSAPITAATVGTALSGINSSSVGNVMAMKPTVEKSGAMGSTGGMLAIQTPYLIITRPKQCLPVNQNTYTGYPSYITTKLSDITGFTTLDSIHLSNMSCTDDEKKEIENILMQGVIL